MNVIFYDRKNNQIVKNTDLYSVGIIDDKGCWKEMLQHSEFQCEQNDLIFLRLE